LDGLKIQVTHFITKIALSHQHDVLLYLISQGIA